MAKVIHYRSYNSGGDYWLSERDWHLLEKAGWDVHWSGGYYDRNQAESATRRGLTLQEAKEEFRKITKEDPDEPGCPCCSPPHRFTEEDE